jgi:hypothetical protein
MKAGSISNSKMFINGIDVTAAYDNETTLVSNTYITEVRMSRTGAGDGIQFSKFLLDGADLLIPTSPEVTVVSTPTLNPPQMTVSGGTWSTGDTITKSMSGTGTVSSSNLATNTMVLSASNDQWIDGYSVATPTKPAVVTTAYLQFNAVGQVTGYQPTPVEPRAMDNKSNPTLTFPATFPDTGDAPDVEFLDANAYIQTSVQLKNDAGSSATVASNKVVPQTSVRSVVAAGQLESNADDVKAMGMQLATHDQRIADHTAAKRQQVAADFETNLRRYTP